MGSKDVQVMSSYPALSQGDSNSPTLLATKDARSHTGRADSGSEASCVLPAPDSTAGVRNAYMVTGPNPKSPYLSSHSNKWCRNRHLLAHQESLASSSV